MLVGNHMRTGVGNNSHTVALIQSDAADGATAFADTSRGGESHVVSGYGGIAHSSTVHKLGASSIYFNSGKWLDMLDSVDWMFGDGDWTMEAWLYSGTVLAHLFGQTDDPVTDWSVAMQRTTSNRVYGITSANGTSLLLSSADGLPVFTWTHIMNQRCGNMMTTYIDGAPGTPKDLTGIAVHDSAQVFPIGRRVGGARQYVGYLSEIKVTKGVAMYPEAGFTPPNRMN